MTSFTSGLLTPGERKTAAHQAPSRARIVASRPHAVKASRLPFRAPVQVDLRTPWWIGDIRIPTRLVLAPMAGVRVEARGGRRRARPLRARDGARARRAPRLRLPEEVLRLVPRPGTLPAPVQAGARPARHDRGGRAAAPRGRSRRRRPARAARGRAAHRRRDPPGHADLRLRRRVARTRDAARGPPGREVGWV